MLSLPPELIVKILSCLPLADLLAVAQSHPHLRRITNILDPFSPITLRLLLTGPPYPPHLTSLAAYSFVPRGVWVEVLARGEAGWVLDELEIPVLKESVWEEAFRRRFLPSWVKWKKDRQCWRSLYMRTLRRLHHRTQVPCNKDEAFTQWITLDRKGTATTNKLYSHNFNPQTIISELKNVNDLSEQPSTVRLLLQLTDISIFVLGTLGKLSSYQPSSNAYSLIHPPLSYPPIAYDDTPSWLSPPFGSFPPASSSRAERRLGRERSYSEGGVRGAGSVGIGGGADGSRGIRWNPQAAVESPDRPSTFASRVDSPEGSTRRGRRREIPLSRTLSGGGSTSASTSTFGATSTSTAGALAGSIGSFFGLRGNLSRSGGTGGQRPSPRTTISFNRPLPSSSSSISSPSPTASTHPPMPPSVARSFASRTPTPPLHLPYKAMCHPQPKESYRFYPNHTPGGEDTRRTPSGLSTGDSDEVEEWPEVDGTARWVGPMIIVAALPSTFYPSNPPPALEGLPYPGSYVSFEEEDLWAIAPWLRDGQLVGKGIGYL